MYLQNVRLVLGQCPRRGPKLDTLLEEADHGLGLAASNSSVQGSHPVDVHVLHHGAALQQELHDLWISVDGSKVQRRSSLLSTPLTSAPWVIRYLTTSSRPLAADQMSAVMPFLSLASSMISLSFLRSREVMIYSTTPR